MKENVLFFGWNQPIPGREKISAEHFQEFVQYLGGLQKNGTIQSFETVFLDQHGGDLNGFFLIKGEGSKLDMLTGTDEWIKHAMRAGFHLQGSGFIRGVAGDLLMERMKMWTDNIPGA
jgi:hypothetical protein